MEMRSSISTKEMLTNIYRKAKPDDISQITEPKKGNEAKGWLKSANTESRRSAQGWFAELFLCQPSPVHSIQDITVTNTK